MTNTRIVPLTIIVLVAFVSGAVTGVLSWLGGANPANAILVGFNGFAGAASLALALYYFANGAKRKVRAGARRAHM